MDQIKLRIEGRLPLLLHNNQMADPLNIFKKAVDQITTKKKRTDSDVLLLSRIEWEGGLYFDSDGFLAMPGQNIERMILDAAKKNKNGVKVKERCVKQLLPETDYLFLLRPIFVKIRELHIA